MLEYVPFCSFDNWLCDPISEIGELALPTIPFYIERLFTCLFCSTIEQRIAICMHIILCTKTDLVMSQTVTKISKTTKFKAL